MKTRNILYVGQALSHKYIRKVLEKHTEHLKNIGKEIYPEQLEEARMDHADLIIYECQSFMQITDSDIDLDIELICHARIMARKNIPVLMIARGHHIDYRYQVYAIDECTIRSLSEVGFLWYNHVNNETSNATRQPGDRFFKVMNWAVFEKKFVSPRLK